jgi:hypothetical protein
METSNLLYDPLTFTDTEVQVQPPSEEAIEMFRQQVSEWSKLDDQIRKLGIAIRERRIHQRALTSKIQDFMIMHGYDNLTTNAGKIKSSVRQVKQPLKVSDIRDKILALQHLSGEELVAQIFESERPTVEKRSLRRVMPKVSLSLDV